MTEKSERKNRTVKEQTPAAATGERLPLPAAAEAAIARLEEAGFAAYAVGGCVRDLLLQKEPGDVDITTSARPEEIQRVFSADRVIPTGLKHGTVTLLLQGEPVEITTHRVDVGYTDGRHPDAVRFSDSLAADLSRRDFTINGIAYCERSGIVDLFGGRADLAAGVIRTIGDGEQRFSEDALRILRAFRFQAQLGFALAPETKAAAKKCAPLLAHISAERIAAELKKLLLSADPTDALRNMGECGLLPSLLLPVEEKRLAAIRRAPGVFSLRLALLLSGASPEETQERVAFLKLDRKTAEETLFLLAERERAIPADPAAVKWAMYQMSPQRLALLADYEAALVPQNAAAWRWAQGEAERIRQRGECWNLLGLAVRGNDLAEAGFPGPAIGQMLERMLKAVITGELPNEREALLSFCAKTATETKNGR